MPTRSIGAAPDRDPPATPRPLIIDRIQIRARDALRRISRVRVAFFPPL